MKISIRHQCFISFQKSILKFVILLSVYFINRQSDLLGQNNSIRREQRVQEMEREERKISKYVSMKMKHPISSEIKDEISNQMKCGDDSKRLSNSES